MSNNELVLDIMNTIEEIEEDGNTIVEDNYWLGFLFVKVGSDVYNFQGEEYDMLHKEYENSWLSDHITFEEYIMYVSQSW